MEKEQPEQIEGVVLGGGEFKQSEVIGAETEFSPNEVEELTTNFFKFEKPLIEAKADSEKLLNKVKDLGGSTEDIEKARAIGEQYTKDIEQATESLLTEFTKSDPETLKKRVQEAADFISKNEGVTAEDLEKEFALDRDTAAVYFNLAKTFGNGKGAEQTEPDTQEQGQSENSQEESIQEDEPEQTRSERHPILDIPEEPEITETEYVGMDRVRQAEVRGQNELRHLERSAEDVGEIRFEKYVRDRVRRVSEGFNAFLANENVRELAQGVFGNEANLGQLNTARVTELAGSFVRRRGGGIFSFFKKLLGFDQPFRRVVKKAARLPRTVGYRVGSSIDSAVSAGVAVIERPLARFRSYRARIQEEAALRQLETGRITDPERVRTFIRKAGWAREYHERMARPVSQRY